MTRSRLLFDDLETFRPAAARLARSSGRYFEVDDLLQETRLRLWSFSQSTYRDAQLVDARLSNPAQRRAYVLRVLTNAANTLLRQRRTGPKSAGTGVSDFLIEVIDNRPNFTPDAERAKEFLDAVKEKLSNVGRRVFILVRQRRSIAEIASELVRSKRTVSRIFSEIRQVMNEVAADFYGADAWKEFQSDMRASFWNFDSLDTGAKDADSR